MSKMFTEISRIVNEDISSRVTQYDVIFEAITNAIHSNSTDIKCFLNFNGNLIKDGDIEIGRIKVDTIKVVDIYLPDSVSLPYLFSNYKAEEVYCIRTIG